MDEVKTLEEIAILVSEAIALADKLPDSPAKRAVEPHLVSAHSVSAYAMSHEKLRSKA